MQRQDMDEEDRRVGDACRGKVRGLLGGTVSERFKAHFRASLSLALHLRLKYIVGLVVNLLIGLLFPLLMTFSIVSTAPKENLTFNDIYLDSPCLNEGICYTFAWGPAGDRDVEAFMAGVFSEARGAMLRKEMNDIGFQTLEELHNFLTTDGMGHVGVGFFVENRTRTIRLYCNNKPASLPLMLDISLPDSTLLQIVRIMNKVNSGVAGYNVEFYNTMSLFFRSIGATSISIVSMTFIVSGMYTLSNIGIMKQERRYEYLVCQGLHRLAYQIANAVITLGEMGIMLLGTILICFYFNIGSVSNPWLTVVVLLLSIFPTMAQNISWSLFCSAVIQKSNTMQLLFFLPSMLVSIVQMIIAFSSKNDPHATANRGVQFLVAFMSFLFPPFANSSFFVAASMVFSRDGMNYSTRGKVMSVAEGLTTSTKYYPNLLVLAFMGILSGVVFFLLAIYQEYTCSTIASPQKPKGFFLHWLRTRRDVSAADLIAPLIDDEPREHAISIKDVSVIYPYGKKAAKDGNALTGDVIHAKYVIGDTPYTTLRGYAVREKDTKALYHLTLNLPYNRVIGLLGANGSGKSTLLKVLLGLQKPTSQRYLPNKYSRAANGDVRLLGKYHPVVAEEALYSGRHMALVFQENILLPRFSVREQMNILARITLYDLPLEQRAKLVHSSLESMGLEHHQGQKVETLSGGQKRRLNIAMAIMLCEANLAKLLIMDEPACGVDIESRTFLWKYLKRLQIQAQQEKRQFCVLLTTHLFEEVEELCDDVVILREGRLLAAGSQLFFKTEFAGKYQLLLNWPNSSAVLTDVRDKYFGAQADDAQPQVVTDPCNPNHSTLTISYADQAWIPNILNDLFACGIPHDSCALHTALLSEIFIRQQERDIPESPTVEHDWYLE